MSKTLPINECVAKMVLAHMKGKNGNAPIQKGDIEEALDELEIPHTPENVDVVMKLAADASAPAPACT